MKIARQIILYFLFLISLINTLSANSAYNDSLIVNKADRFFKASNYDSSIHYYKLIITNEIDKELILKSAISISDIYRIERNFDSAYLYLAFAESNLGEIQIQKPVLFYEYKHLKASIEGDKGNYHEAINIMQSAIDFYVSIFDDNDTLLAKSYNNLGTYNYYLGNNENAKDNYVRALDISKFKKNRNSDEAATYYQNVGIMYAREGDFDIALEYFNKNLEINKLILAKDDPRIARIYLNLGRMYYALSQHDDALFYNKLAERAYIDKFGMDYASLGLLYLNTGAIHFDKSDFDEAELYFNNALRIYNLNFNNEHPNVGRIYNNLGLLSFYQKKFEQALGYYKRNLSIAIDPASVIVTLHNIAQVYKELNQFEKADGYYKQLISYSENNFGESHFEIGNAYMHYGEFLLFMDNHEALYYFENALKVFNNVFEESNVYSSRIYKLIGDFNLNGNLLREAIMHYDAALMNNIFEKGMRLDGNKASIDNCLSPHIYILTVLQKAKALAMLYQRDYNSNLLLQSLECYKLAMNAYENLKSDVGEDSKLYLANATRESFDFSFKILHELYTQAEEVSFIEEAFSFAEKGKASVLLSAIKDVDAIKFSGIPQHFQELEKDIKEKINGYESLVYEEKNANNPDSAKISLWDHKLFILDQKHDSLLDEFEANYPSYYSLKHDVNVNSIKDVQSYLKPDQLLIEYVLTDSLLYRFTISNDASGFDKIALDSVFYQDLNAMRYANSIDFSTHGMKDYKSFVYASNRLYNKLFGDLNHSLKDKKLIIIPDGRLGYLPFESLVTELPEFSDRIDYRNLSYLLRKSPLSYTYSSTLLLRNIGNKSLEKSMIAFAPEYKETISASLFNERGLNLMDELDPLVYAQEEVNSINSIFHGDVFRGSLASETNFKNNVESHGIIHLAMHTVLDDENPMQSKLVFSHPIDTLNDGYLNTYEIYELELNAQLAVLSACNTGSGKINRGEGIMSLSRGFIYAGVPSIVMTLWEIEDKSGSTIMTLFYKNLKDGMEKDVALQKAKIDYLNNSPQLRAHPYFWAAYVDIGDTNPIQESYLTKYRTFFIIILIVVLLLGIWIRNRVRHKYST